MKLCSVYQNNLTLVEEENSESHGTGIAVMQQLANGGFTEDIFLSSVFLIFIAVPGSTVSLHLAASG